MPTLDFLLHALNQTEEKRSGFHLILGVHHTAAINLVFPPYMIINCHEQVILLDTSYHQVAIKRWATMWYATNGRKLKPEVFYLFHTQ
jgi:hypothetical protein